MSEEVVRPEIKLVSWWTVYIITGILIGMVATFLLMSQNIGLLTNEVNDCYLDSSEKYTKYLSCQSQFDTCDIEKNYYYTQTYECHIDLGDCKLESNDQIGIIQHCGDGVCTGRENPGNCLPDCTGYCGDRYCQSTIGEDASWCGDCIG